MQCEKERWTGEEGEGKMPIIFFKGGGRSDDKAKSHHCLGRRKAEAGLPPSDQFAEALENMNPFQPPLPGQGLRGGGGG